MKTKAMYLINAYSKNDRNSNVIYNVYKRFFHEKAF